MANSLSLTVNPAQLAFMGGGEARPATEFDSGNPLLRDGRQVRRLPGVTALLDGVPLENFTVETVADVDNLGPGGLLAAQGEVSVTIRADAKAGFNGGAPRGSLAGRVFVESLAPVAAIADLIAQAARRQPAKAD